MEPAEVYSDEALVLVLRGSFEVPLKAELDEPSETRLAPYGVQLLSGDQMFDLPPGEFRGTGRVETMLGPGTPPGMYAVRLTDPWGRSALLSDAFHVRFKFASIDGGAIDIDPPDAGPVRSPPLARFIVQPPYDLAVGLQTSDVKVDASPSSDSPTPSTNLRVSWNFSGATTLPPWTPWTTSTTDQGALAYGTQRIVLAVQDVDGDIGYSIRGVSVVAEAELCFVTTPLAVDDGATLCNDSNAFGPDGVLSLDEALRLTASPQGNESILLFADPQNPATFTGPPVIIDSVVQIIGMPGVTLGREIIAGNNPNTLIGIELAGPKLTVPAGMKLFLLDSHVHDTAIVSAGQLIVERTRFERCSGACIAVDGANAELIVTQSSFEGTGIDSAITAPQCIGNGSGFSLDLVGNTFTQFATAIRVGVNCIRPTRILHDTFHGNAVGVDYLGGSGHLLRNNIFTAQQAAAVWGCEASTISFAAGQRQDHLLYGNASSGCIGSDPGIVTVNPQYVSSVNRDFRLRHGSPAIDAAPDLGIDANGAAPTNYQGAGPDFGGRETY